MVASTTGALANGDEVRTPATEPSCDLEARLAAFVEETEHVVRAVAVSSDGLLLAASGDDQHDGDGLDQLAAIVAGMASMARGAVSFFGQETLIHVVLESLTGYTLIARINDEACLAVMATADCDLGLIGYATTLLLDDLEAILTPTQIDELKNLLTV